MSRHPGQPTDDEQDAAAEAFYGAVMPRTPAPLTVVTALEDELMNQHWNVFDAEGFIVATVYRSAADARAFVALPALMTALKEVLYIAERNKVLTNNRGGQSVGNSPTMQRSQAIELLKICRAALAQADGPKEQP